MDQNTIYLDMSSLASLKNSIITEFFPRGIVYPDGFVLDVKTPKGSTKYSHFGHFTMVSETDINFYSKDGPYKLDLKLIIETAIEKGESAKSKYTFEGMIKYNDTRKMVSGIYVPI